MKYVLAFLALLMLPVPASAQQIAPAPWSAFCGPKGDLAEQLRDRHGEVPIGIGAMGDGAALVLYASPAGSFTVIVEMPARGAVCIIASGEAYQPARQKLPGSPS